MSHELIGPVRAGDRRALARAITLIESTRADHRAEARELLAGLLPAAGGAIRVAISGPPGAGKSSLIETLGLRLVDAGSRVAVLAIDPSSSRFGGSILGDKTRMIELSRRTEAFIRPTPARGALGGVARRTREAMIAVEAGGADVVLVETVGIGQSEIAAAAMVDLFMLVVAPGAGDDLQGIKRGVMELADLVVVNKADGELAAAARRALADYGAALGLMRPRHDDLPAVALAASALTGDGIDEVWAAVTERHQALAADGRLQALRAAQAREWMWSEVREGALDAIAADGAAGSRARELESEVAAGRILPVEAARELLAALLREPPPA